MTVTYFIALFMFSYFNGTFPAIFEDYFTKNEYLHNYNTRSASNIHIDYEKVFDNAVFFPRYLCPSGTHPRGRICNSFLSWRSIPDPWASRKRQFPNPAPDRPHLRFLVHLFDPYKSKTTRFHNFYKSFPQFIERGIIDIIM